MKRSFPEVRHPEILEIDTYAPGKSKLSSGKIGIKLSSNENPFGTSENVQTLLRTADFGLHRYPEGSSTELREALAGLYKLNVNQIVCGAGSDELILLLTQAYAGPGDEVICSENSFLMYPIAALRVGARPVYAPERNFTADVDSLLSKVTERTRIVFLAHPNNPTGTYLGCKELFRLRENLPSRILLILDNAYEEFVTADDYDNGFALVARGDTVITHTFSKIYGMAAFRIGWSYSSPETADILHRIRGPFNVSTLAQMAGIAAIQDQNFIVRSREHNTYWRKRMTKELSDIQLKVIPSQANFILVAFPYGEKQADAADAFLQSRHIIVRSMKAYKLPHCLRISIGKEEDNLMLLKALKDFIAG